MEEVRDNGQAEVKQEISTIWEHGRERFIWSRAQTGVRKGKDVRGGWEGKSCSKRGRGGGGKAHVNLSCLNKQEKAKQHKI